MTEEKNVIDVASVMETYRLPGLSLGILQDGITELKSYGVASKATGAPVDATTVFGVGSISKVFTATLAMRMVELGMLDLDAPIIRYFPQLALSDEAARNTVTMRHLLTHTAGFDGDGFEDFGNADDALANFVATFGKREQVSPPGELWSYSNNGFGLAGAVLGHVAGSNYEAAMREYVLKPLGMHMTGFGQAPALRNSATGYEFGDNGNEEERLPDSTTRSANPAGGVHSCIIDLLTFARMHLGLAPFDNDDFLSQATRDEMQRTQVKVSSIEEWGIGWGKMLAGDTWALEHGGWMSGYRAQLTLLPDREAAFVMLTNGPLGHTALGELQKAILADRFRLREVPQEHEIDLEIARRYAGTYRQSHITATIEPSETHDGLVMRLKTKWRGEANDSPILCQLRPITDEEFVIDGGEFDDGRIVFIRNDDGTVRYARILQRLCAPVSER